MKNYLFFCLSLLFCGCTTAQKQETQQVLKTEKTVKSTEQTVAKATDSSSTSTINGIDTLKIYEESEVSRAFPNISNKELLDFHMKHFKYPDIEPINGRGWAYFIVERDGSVSDVKIEKGIHPEIDKEFIRVLKLMPIKFNPPGKINGVPVRSKYRMPMTSRFQ